MQKINEKLITEINKLIDLIHERIEAEASQARLDKQQFNESPTYQNISKIKKQLSIPFQKKLNLKLIYKAKQAIHQYLTAPDYQTRARVDAVNLSKHRPEDFQGNSRFLFKYFYSPLSGLFKFIDFVIFEKLFNHYFSFRLTAFFFPKTIILEQIDPNTIILEQFDKVIKGATLYNAHFDCLAKQKPKTNFFSTLPEDVLRNIAHYLPAKDLEPIFLDLRLHASFKSVIEDYHSATNYILKRSLKYKTAYICYNNPALLVHEEYIWLINPALLVHENSVGSLILMAKLGFPAQLFETINPRKLAQNFNKRVEELQKNGISKGVITTFKHEDYHAPVIGISIFNDNVIEHYYHSKSDNYFFGEERLSHAEMAKRINQAV
jgi:hypothetical protein